MNSFGKITKSLFFLFFSVHYYWEHTLHSVIPTPIPSLISETDSHYVAQAGLQILKSCLSLPRPWVFWLGSSNTCLGVVSRWMLVSLALYWVISLSQSFFPWVIYWGEKVNKPQKRNKLRTTGIFTCPKQTHKHSVLYSRAFSKR